MPVADYEDLSYHGNLINGTTGVGGVDEASKAQISDILATGYNGTNSTSVYDA